MAVLSLMMGEGLRMINHANERHGTELSGMAFGCYWQHDRGLVEVYGFVGCILTLWIGDVCINSISWSLLCV